MSDDTPELFYGRRCAPPRRLARLVLLACAAAAAFAAWITYPWTKERCLTDAARQPTHLGVQLMAEQCLKRFGGGS